MKKDKINDKIYNFVLKKRPFIFHIILFFFTGGLWLIFYYAIKISYNYNNKKKEGKRKQYQAFKIQKIIDNMDYGTVVAFQRDGKFRNEYKRYLVQVTSHGGCCDKCKKWENKILIDDLFSDGKPDGKHILLSEAVKQGLFHSGCSHGIDTYFPELEGIENETEEEYQADWDYINEKLSEMVKKR